MPAPDPVFEAPVRLLNPEARPSKLEGTRAWSLDAAPEADTVVLACLAGAAAVPKNRESTEAVEGPR